MPDPRLTIQAHVHPRAMLVDASERVVSVRFDVLAPSLGEGAVARPLSLALVMDCSGSMDDIITKDFIRTGETVIVDDGLREIVRPANGGKLLTKLDAAKAAAARVVECLADEDVFTLVAFNEQAQVVVHAGKVAGRRAAILADINKMKAQSATKLALGMQAALEQLTPHCRDGAAGAMFLLTDGKVDEDNKPLCFTLSPEIRAQGISVYAGGIGDQYEHAFLEQLCADPTENGKYLVDHIDVSNMEKMSNVFESYLKRKGHVITNNVRLFITFPRRVTIKSIQAEEHAQVIQLDGQQSIPIADLYAGKQQRYLIEFATTPSIVGNMQLAHFRLRYDLTASNVRQAETETDAVLEITEDPSRANIPNTEVMQVARKLQATKLSEAAEADLAKKDIRGATKKLERVTRALEDLGEHDQAREVKERAAALEKSDPQNLDLEIKRLRGTTKRLSE